MSSQHLTVLASRVTALEQAQVEHAKAQVDNVREQRRLQGQSHSMSATIDDLNERYTESVQRADEHHVFITQVNEQLDRMMDVLQNVRAEVIPKLEISTPATPPAQTLQVKPPGVLDTHTEVEMRRCPLFAVAQDIQEIDEVERPITNIPVPRRARAMPIASSPAAISSANGPNLTGVRIAHS